MGEVPAITYPEGTIDVSEAALALRLHGTDGVGVAAAALERIEADDRAVLVMYAGTTHERLLTPQGRIMLLGDTYGWWVGTKQVAAAVVAERYPRLAEYVATRTASFIAQAEHDLQFEHSEINRRFVAGELARLKNELVQVRALETLPR